jgi:hypothetical protein
MTDGRGITPSSVEHGAREKIEQCRRLARQITDPTTSCRLFELANEYVQHIRENSEK